jgi:hypothetical protein
MRFMSCMRWGYERILGGAEGNFLVIPNLRLVIDYGMTWYKDKALKVAYPELFSLARSKDVSVAILLEFSSNSLMEC